jgi:pimeloyl-ACP methyl ester carboxylesterase
MNQFLNYKNCPVYYSVQGHGSTVVLLHGFLENRKMWTPIVELLSKKYRVVSIDLLGHGKSGNMGYVHTMEEQAELVRAVLADLRVRRITLVGHSMGGYIGLAFGKKYPQMLKGLLLMNSTAKPDSPEKKVNRDRAITAVQKNYKTFVRLAIPQLFAPYNRSVFTDTIEQLTKEALQMSPQGIIAALEGMKIRKGSVGLLKQCSFPMGIIIGLQDPVLPFEDLMDQIRSTAVIAYEFPDGHMSHIENEEKLTQAITSFLGVCH